MTVCEMPVARPLPPSMVERVTLIMDAFERRSTLLTLEEITVRTRLPRSTAHRILDQLVQVDWLEHSALGYGLGTRALGLGGRDGEHDQIRTAAAQVLQELFWRTGLVVHLGVLDATDVYYLDKLGGPFAATLPSRVGGRVPAHTTAIGKAILAWEEPEDLDELLRGQLTRRTEHTISDLAVLHRELAMVRIRNGIAHERGEAAPGVACVAAAVRGQRRAVAAVSVCGEARSMQMERVTPLVLDAAREVSRLLFPELAKPRRVREVLDRHDADWTRHTRVLASAAGS